MEIIKQRGLKCLFIVNQDWYFKSHWLARAEAVRELGLNVWVALPPGKEVQFIRSRGFKVKEIAFSRRGINIVVELLTLYQINHVIRDFRPDLIFTSTIKPNLYGGLLGRAYSIPTLCSFNGLGTVFVSESITFRIVRKLILLVIKIVGRGKNSFFLFQNEHDKSFMVSRKICTDRNSEIIAGSGIDTKRFYFMAEPKTSEVKILLASRMLKDKGIYELIDAARTLKFRKILFRLIVAGIIDDGNPGSIPKSQLEEWQKEGLIDWLGEIKDMPTLYSEAHIVVLPSYREGFPRGLIEAASCGKPIVATNVPGCNDVVCHDENGLLVPVQDSNAIADAIQYLVENPDVRKRYGENGRKRAESRFSEEIIIKQTKELIIRVLKNRYSVI